MADANRIAAALRYIDEQQPADPLARLKADPIGALRSAFERKVDPIINNARRTFATGGGVGDILRAYGEAGAPANAAMLRGMGTPYQEPTPVNTPPSMAPNTSYGNLGDASAQMAGGMIGDPLNAIPLAGPAARGAVAAGKAAAPAGRYAGEQLARGLEAHLMRSGGILPMAPSLPQSKMQQILESGQAPSGAPTGERNFILPRSEGMYTPGIAQIDLPRSAGGREIEFNERTQELLGSRAASNAISQAIKKGEPLGVKEWYGTEPLRQFSLNEGLSQQEFDRMLAQLASASQRNPVEKQTQLGSYLWNLDKSGQLTPEKELLTNALRRQGAESGPNYIELPPNIGGLAQSAIFDRAKTIAAGEIEKALPPTDKLGTFYRNYQGNLKPVTVDVNAMHLPIMQAKQADWLVPKFVRKDDKGNVIYTVYPKKEFEEGRLTMADALKRTEFWKSAPGSAGEYSGIETLWQRAAKRAGVDPAEAQALGWYGGGDLTKLRSAPETYMENLERMARQRAKNTGKTPLEVMKQFVRGKERLGMVGVAAPAAPDLLKEENK
tara:strand:+ start:288 stop:1946 length:1659 start_codon:yes stop_codon:yes gene_type:complete